MLSVGSAYGATGMAGTWMALSRSLHYLELQFLCLEQEAMGPSQLRQKQAAEVKSAGQVSAGTAPTAENQ